MSELLKIKIGRHEYTITTKDRFMDNGACIQLITQRGPFEDWDYSALVLPQREIKRIAHFHRRVIQNDKNCVIFSLKSD